MNAGFLKRAFSSLVDITIVVVIIYLTFIAFGRPILRNQVPNFDEINSAYQEILDAYNEDLATLGEEYSAAIELANEDETLEAAAQTTYQEKLQMLESQNSIDIEPFNRPLSAYFLTTVYYYLLGFLILMTVYALATKGKTLGRRMMQIRLDGNVHVFTIFFHDIVFKYFFIILVFVVSMYAGLLLLLLSLFVDLMLMSLSKKKATLRDILLKLNIVKAGYGY